MANNTNDPSGLFQLKAIQQRNFSERETSVLDLFVSTIQSATLETAAEAARRLDFFCSFLDPEKNEVEAYLWTIWEVIAEMAGSSDVTSEIHVWLVNVLQSLVRCAKGNFVVRGIEQRVWGDLPLFGQCLDAYYSGRDPYLVAEKEYKPEYVQSWRRISSFMARCTGAGLLVIYTQAADALRGAFEKEPSKDQEISATECRILVACEWLAHGARPLFEWARQNSGHFDVTEKDTEYIEGGPLYNGPSVVCLQRWGFWQNRLEELRKKESGLREEIRNAMLEAAETMTRIERSIGNNL